MRAWCTLNNTVACRGVLLLVAPCYWWRILLCCRLRATPTPGPLSAWSEECTATRPRSHAATLPNCHTDTQTHSHAATHTATQPRSQTAAQTHSHAATQPHCHTAAQTHRHTATVIHMLLDTQPHSHNNVYPVTYVLLAYAYLTRCLKSVYIYRVGPIIYGLKCFEIALV